MTLKFEQKKKIVAAMAEVASNAMSMVAADYRGLTSVEMTTLRAEARKVGVKLKIAHNTLTRRALKGTPYECMSGVFTGPVLLAFTNEEPSVTARLLRDFAKVHRNLEVKALSLKEQMLDISQLDAMASLPTRHDALAKLLFVMQAPIVKFVRVLREPQVNLVRTLVAVHRKKQAEAA